MSKMKAMFLNAVLLLSFVNFAGASDFLRERAASGNDLKTGPAFELLASIAPSMDFLDLVTVHKVAPEPFYAKGEKAIEPGSGLSPLVEDPIRIKAILKLVSDIYNNISLPYSQDGTTFTNKEGRLPKQALGFYKEYTLLTGNAPHTVVIDGKTYKVAPDLSARGSERVVIGGGQFLYYTPDHYASFIQLTVVK